MAVNGIGTPSTTVQTPTAAQPAQSQSNAQNFQPAGTNLLSPAIDQYVQQIVNNAARLEFPASSANKLLQNQRDMWKSWTSALNSQLQENMKPTGGGGN